MPAFDFIVPITYDPKSNDTFINKRLYDIKGCVDENDPNAQAGFWNCVHCGNDENYNTPYVQGDKIYFQYILTGTSNVIPVVRDTDGNEISVPGLVSTETGTDDLGISYMNIIIDTGVLENGETFARPCFYVEFNVFKCTSVDLEAISECIEGDGIEPGQSELVCWETFCEGEKVVVETGTYRLVSDDCSKTVMLEGYYPKHDCNGNYHAEFTGGGTNSYKPKVRVYGTIEWYDHSTEETLVNRLRTRSRGIDKYRLRTKKTPPFVARQIAIILDGQKTLVDSIEYKGGTKMSKDFDEGASWIISVDLFIECGENNFACN